MSENGALGKWLGRLAPSTASTNKFHFVNWMNWMVKGQGKFAKFSPDELVAFQGEHRDYQILDYVQEYVKLKEGRINYKRKIYSSIKSFFLHNRVPLPQDPSFSIFSEKEKVVGTLTIDEFKHFLLRVNKMYRALFLCMFQAGMGVAEALYWSEHGLASLRKQIRAGTNPIKIDLPGRKKGRNIRPYYTFIGKDAIDALEDYLDERPDVGSHIFLSNYKTPIRYKTLHQYWIDNMARLGLIQPIKGNTGNRYGKNPHELRDLFRTRFHLSRRDPKAPEFFMGHIVDPLEYNKAFRDEYYAVTEYKEASPWLNILSEDPEHIHVSKVEDRVTELMKEKDLIMQEVLKRLEALENSPISPHS